MKAKKNLTSNPHGERAANQYSVKKRIGIIVATALLATCFIIAMILVVVLV